MTSVTIPVHKQVSPRHICEHIQERSLLVVSSVTILALELKISRGTNSHTLEKSLFVCKQCNYSSIQFNDLRYHMLSHTGEKPFACKQCNYSCKQTRDLKNHMRTHVAKTKTIPLQKKLSIGQPEKRRYQFFKWKCLEIIECLFIIIMIVLLNVLS